MQTSGYSADVTAAPVTVRKFGQSYGYPFDPDATADEIAAFGNNDGTLRGTSSLISSGFQIGFVGNENEEIVFFYWDSKEQLDAYKARTLTVNDEHYFQNTLD